ncbi:MAG TPA: outer-membrane lipoprotein carrier protein LolA [Patescibacteria group bacterium]|nr:outer-membrane lipoprotein carrier protein LolA [Patescibacteria group bacterium]
MWLLREKDPFRTGPRERCERGRADAQRAFAGCDPGHAAGDGNSRRAGVRSGPGFRSARKLRGLVLRRCVPHFSFRPDLHAFGVHHSATRSRDRLDSGATARSIRLQRSREEGLHLRHRRRPFFSPDDKQLTVRRLSEDEKARLPVVFLTRPADLGRQYEITVDSGEMPAETRLLLTPRVARTELAWLRLAIQNDGSVRELSYQDSAGNRTEFRFEAWKSGKARPAADFRITGPPGTRIIEN